MRILQVVPHYVPAYRFGGPLRVAHALSVAFVQQGHSVTVCTTNLASERDDLDVVTGEMVLREGVQIYYERVPVWRRWGFSPALWERVAAELPGADVVLVHAHYQFANWAAARLARRAAIPYVIFAHASLRQEAIAHNNAWAKRAYLRLLEQQNLDQALFVAFNAPEELEASLFREKGRVVPNGIERQMLNNLPAPGTFRARYPQLHGRLVFLFLGRLDIQQKGLDMLLPAFAQLHGQDPRCHLVLAGPDEAGALAKLQDMVQALGLETAVTFTGLVSGAEKWAALRDTDCFVLPSRFEGSSVALLEALACGLPVLVTDRVGLSGEVAASGAGLVVGPDITAIIGGLTQLAREEVRGPMRGQGTALVVRAYTWDRIARDLMREIEKEVGPKTIAKSGGAHKSDAGLSREQKENAA